MIRTVNRCLFFLIVIGFFGACSTEIDLNADPKEIYTLYGVLDPGASEQFIRISTGFLTESNALEYARANNLSARGLTVTLTGGGRVYTAVETDSVLKNPEDGTFYPYTFLYRIDTEGANALKEATRYELLVSRPDNSDFFLRAGTFIPESARFSTPRLNNGPGQTRCLSEVALDKIYQVHFSPGEGSAAYELRAFLDYKENGEEKQLVFGPTGIFSGNFRCNVPGATCYQFGEKEILSVFNTRMDRQPGSVYTYGVTPNTQCGLVAALPQALWFELTSVDSVLQNYITANDPQFTDLNTVRPEYTNIESNTLAFGVFGSTSRAIAIGRLSACAEFLLGLNGTPRPATPCEF